MYYDTTYLREVGCESDCSVPILAKADTRSAVVTLKLGGVAMAAVAPPMVDEDAEDDVVMGRWCIVPCII